MTNARALIAMLSLISGCSAKESVEEFPISQCTYEATNTIQFVDYQAGCSVYQTDSKGNSTGICIAPIYATQKQRAINVSCRKSEWRNE